MPKIIAMSITLEMKLVHNLHSTLQKPIPLLLQKVPVMCGDFLLHNGKHIKLTISINQEYNLQSTLRLYFSMYIV